MKTFLTMVLAIVAFCATAFAEMVNKEFAAAKQTIAGSTNSQTLVLRGLLEGVHIDVGTATTRTQTVTVASAQQTLFTKAVTADGWFPLQYAQYGSTGAAITFNEYWSTNTGVNSVEAQTWYGKAPMAGDITVTIVGGNAANITNTTTVTLIYSK